MKREKTLITSMTEGPLLKQLLLCSAPIIFGFMFQSTYTIIDMAVVGKFLGSNGLSAVGIGGLLLMLLTSLNMGVCFGGQILLSQYVGASDHENISKGIGTFLTLTVPFALGSGLLGIIFCNPLLRAMNTPAEIFASARSYFLICCIGVLFIYGYNGIGAILRGVGETRLPMVFIGVATVLNIALDYIFIGILDMGVGGAALATVIAQGIAFLLSILFLYLRRSSLGFDYKISELRIDKKVCSALLKLSLPIVIFGSFMSLSSMFVNSNVNVYGVAASAIDGIGNKLFMITSAITMGLNTAGVVIIGQCFGAGKIERIKSTFWLVFILSLTSWAILGIVMFLFPVPLLRIFTTDESVLAFAPQYLRIYVISMFGTACSASVWALFEGVGNTKLEMMTGLVDCIGGKIFLSKILGSVLGLMGFWLGKALATFVTPVFGFAYYFSGLWKKRKADWIQHKSTDISNEEPAEPLLDSST